MVGPLTAFMRGEDGEESEAGALLVANALVNIEMIALAFKKEPELPPLRPGEED